MPNFLIVGAVKAGTTSLYHYLCQHPEVFMPEEKEPHHFAPTKWCGHPAMPRQEYENLFASADRFKARGEASTGYLYYPESPQMIYDAIPSCKIVIILRNPVARAFSGYSHERREGLETVEFEDALAEELKATRFIRGGEFSFNYLKQGLVCENIRLYQTLFGNEQVHICLFDDLVAEPCSVMKPLFDFLEVDHDFEGKWSYRYNPSGNPRSQSLHALIDGENALSNLLRHYLKGRPSKTGRPSLWHRLRDWNLAINDKPTLQPDTEAFLQDYFRTEVACLESLLQRDLSHWISRTP